MRQDKNLVEYIVKYPIQIPTNLLNFYLFRFVEDMKKQGVPETKPETGFKSFYDVQYKII